MSSAAGQGLSGVGEAGGEATLSDVLPNETHNASQTLDLGRTLANALFERCARGHPVVVALHGSLGAGKTHLVKGVCSGLGIDPARVTSPTFTIVHEYPGGRVPVFHVDAFRLEGPDDLLAIGVEDVLKSGLVLIEWPDRLSELLPADTIHLEIDVLSDTRRSFRLRTASADTE